jgi:hypothetical protein
MLAQPGKSARAGDSLRLGDIRVREFWLGMIALARTILRGEGGR